MGLKDISIRKKLLRFILLTSLVVFLLSGIAYSTYEYLTFRRGSIQELAILGEIVASNSTAALAFDSPKEAGEILSALKADKKIVAAALFDKKGKLFTKYPPNAPDSIFPATLNEEGYEFESVYIAGFKPVRQGSMDLGTLYLKADIGSIYEKFQLFGSLGIITVIIIFIVAYYLSIRLQTLVSKPILALSKTAEKISMETNYSVRAIKYGNDEVGLLTDSFNQMLSEIEARDHSISEAQYRIEDIIQSMGDSFVSLNNQWEYTIVNEKAIALLGKSKQELIGKTLWEVNPEIVGTDFDEKYRTVMEKRVSAKFEVYYEVERIWMEVRAYPHRDGVAIFHTDITERKEASRKLRAQLFRLDLLSQITRAISERQDLLSIFQVALQSLEDNMPMDFGCICLLDDARDQLEVKCVGSKSYALAGIPELSAVQIEQNGLSRALGGVLVYEGNIKQSSTKFLKLLADTGMHSVVIAPLAAESKVSGVLVCGRKEENGFSSGDCEFLKQLSEHIALAGHNVELHEALQQAYNDLKQTQQAILQQERLKALGQMSSGIAHDINNAISPISLYTESMLASEPNLSEKARNYLEIILQAIGDVTETVSRMREFYRQREPQISLSEINLNTLIKQVIDLTRAKWSNIPQKQGIVINVETSFDPYLPPIMGVESELRESFTNLIFNAVDAMPEGGIITLRTKVLDRPFDPRIEKFGRFVIAEVVDTGIGMDEETKRRCLEPFYTTKGERGTGLGLSMVFGAIQRHNADIEVSSTRNKGTTFSLIFQANTIKNDGKPFVSIVDSVPQRRRILIIDDDPLLLKSLSDTLETDGHSVIIANGGKDGVDSFMHSKDTNNPFDVVITDLGMPYMDGRKVALLIKEASPKTPVILLTGWGQRLLEEGDIPNGVDRVLSKPPKLRDLRQALVSFEQKRSI